MARLTRFFKQFRKMNSRKFASEIVHAPPAFMPKPTTWFPLSGGVPHMLIRRRIDMLDGA